MKIKQVEAILKSEKIFIVSDGDNCQWLSTHGASYPIYNLPKITNDVLFTLFDIPKDKRDKFIYMEKELPEQINFSDVDMDEQVIPRGNFSLNYGGRNLEPLKISQGIMFIDTKYLKPFAGIKEGYELYERTDEEGRPYIAVKSGLLLIGVISEVNVINDEFIEKIEIMLKLSKVTLENKKTDGGNSVTNEYQCSLDSSDEEDTKS